MKSSDVLKHSFSLISSLEGLRLAAYWDVKRYSIGYGTISYKGETITKQEAEKRAKDYILSDINYLQNIGWDISDPFTVPLLSKGYQYGRGIYSGYLKMSPVERLREFNDSDDIQYANRRNKELSYFYTLRSSGLSFPVFIGFLLLCYYLISNYKNSTKWQS